MSSSNKEWLTIADLAAMRVPGLQVSSVTLHRKANKEKWKKRKREGVQGVAYEYHVSSLPPKAQAALGYSGSGIEECSRNIPPVADSPHAHQLLDQFNALSQEAQQTFLLKASQQQEGNAYDNGAQALLTIWSGLEPVEKELLSKLLVRKGSELLAQLLDDETICLMQLTGERRDAALLLARLLPKDVREILSEMRKRCGLADEDDHQVAGKQSGVA